MRTSSVTVGNVVFAERHWSDLIILRVMRSSFKVEAIALPKGIGDVKPGSGF
jgi:hypothetical protein